MSKESHKIFDVVENVIKKGLVDVGEISISRTNLGRKGGFQDRYLIYLPLNRNYMWRALHSRRVKVRVYLEIPSESEKDRMMEKDLYGDLRETR
jgi:hypothetical protein